MTSFVYKHPLLYDAFIRILYFDGLKILGSMVGKHKRVFEPACGYGRMRRYLDATCEYAGIDRNQKFIRYARKKNLDVAVGDIFDPAHYRRADVVLLADILHHLGNEDIHRLFSISLRYAREKVVIIEPGFVHIGAGKNPFSRLMAKIMSVLDADGINRIGRWLSRKESLQLYGDLARVPAVASHRVTRFRQHDFVEMFIGATGSPKSGPS